MLPNFQNLQKNQHSVENSMRNFEMKKQFTKNIENFENFRIFKNHYLGPYYKIFEIFENIGISKNVENYESFFGNCFFILDFLIEFSTEC